MINLRADVLNALPDLLRNDGMEAAGEPVAEEYGKY
jgi:hypothetical protein